MCQITQENDTQKKKKSAETHAENSIAMHENAELGCKKRKRLYQRQNKAGEKKVSTV